MNDIQYLTNTKYKNFKNIYKKVCFINILTIFTKNLKIINMAKVILNTGKNLEIISDGGRYKLIAKMKVDYCAVSGVFGARDWVFKVIDLVNKQNVNLQTNGIDVFKFRKYQYKKQLLKAIEDANCFNIALSEIKNKNVVKT